MATHDYIIDNQTAPNFRSDLNNALQAIVTQNSSATPPATTYANMFWYETDTDTLWKRNEADSGWISIGTFDEANSKFEPNQTFATQAQAEAGVNTLRPMNPLRTAQAIASQVAVRTAYVSTDQTITSGGLLTLAHGLGVQPKMVMIELVCVTAENGFAISDVIMVGYAATTSGTNRNNAIYYDATNINVRFSNEANCFTYANRTTGNAVSLTNANWNLRVRAFA